MSDFPIYVTDFATVCKLVKKCKGCLADVSFADEVCKSILLTGLCDEEVRREVLGTANVDIKSLDETHFITG